MSEPLRVLHIGPTPFFSDRGCHIRIRGLMLASTAAGIETLLCTYPHGHEVEGVATRRTAAIPGYRKVDAGPSPFKYLADLLLLGTTVRAIGSFRPHVIHGHLHEGALIGWVARTLVFWRRPRLVFDVQGSLTGELEEYGYFRWLRPLRPLFAAVEWTIDHLADVLSCSSAASLAIARDRFGVPPERLHLISDGADVEPARTPPAELRAELGLPGDRPIAVYTGSLLQVKGLDLLQATIAACAARDARVHFALVGYPTEATAGWLRERGLADRVTLPGRVPFAEIGRWLGAADVALEPKAAEAGEASGKVLNYMAAGLPVIALDTAVNRAILGEAGCYAQERSGAALADALVALLATPERRAELGAAALSRSRSTFSWQASAARLAVVYRELLGHPASPHPSETR